MNVVPLGNPVASSLVDQEKIGPERKLVRCSDTTWRNVLTSVGVCENLWANKAKPNLACREVNASATRHVTRQGELRRSTAGAKTNGLPEGKPLCLQLLHAVPEAPEEGLEPKASEPAQPAQLHPRPAGLNAKTGPPKWTRP